MSGVSSLSAYLFFTYLFVIITGSLVYVIFEK